jgi:hypothetical protein
MKNILFSGFAAAGLLAASSASASDSWAFADSIDPTAKMALTANGHKSGRSHDSKFDEPEYRPAMQADRQAYDWGDENSVSFAAPDGSSYRYEGDWQGDYVDPESRIFEGEWSGRVIRQNGVAGPGYPAPRHNAGAPYDDAPREEPYIDDGYHVPSGYEGYERCLKSNGVTGAALGALLGGFAGNRIAGRGDRLGGTLAGAGIGGLLGIAVEKANDKCRHHRPGNYRAPVAYPQYHSQPRHYGWQGGYYYYPQPAVVTVVIGSGVTTTTVTEEVTYDTVRAAPRKRVIRKWKPKPRCICR